MNQTGKTEENYRTSTMKVAREGAEMMEGGWGKLAGQDNCGAWGIRVTS